MTKRSPGPKHVIGFMAIASAVPLLMTIWVGVVIAPALGAFGFVSFAIGAVLYTRFLLALPRALAEEA